MRFNIGRAGQGASPILPPSPNFSGATPALHLTYVCTECLQCKHFRCMHSELPDLYEERNVLSILNRLEKFKVKKEAVGIHR